MAINHPTSQVLTSDVGRGTFFIRLVLLTFVVSACAPAAPQAPASEAPTASATNTETATPSPSETATLTATATFTATPTPTETPTATPYPTVESLRAKVIHPGRLACRFGPGDPYLYKFTFAPTSTIEIVGRMEYSDWVLARAVGGTNRCWVNGGEAYLDIQGERFALPIRDPHIIMAFSNYYGAMSNVAATREGATVTVTYSGLVLVPDRGDDSEQVPYVLEAWVCQGGEHVFIAVGSYSFAAKVVDEPTCNIASHGRVSAAEKHGYVQWVDVPWPAYQDDD